MNATKAKRTSKVESKLSAKELVVAQLREAHRHDAMEGYAGEQLDFRGPSMCDRIAAQMKEEMKGEAPGVVDRQVRARCHEALFLAQLALAAEEVIQLGRRADALQLLALVHEFHLLLVKVESGYRFDEVRWTRQVSHWRETLVGFFGAKRGLAAAIKALEEEYLDGESMLYTETREVLATILSECQRLVSLYEDVVGEAQHRGGEELVGRIPPADARKELDDISRAASVSEGRVLLDRARVEALRAMGMDDAALDVYRTYFAPAKKGARE